MRANKNNNFEGSSESTEEPSTGEYRWKREFYKGVANQLGITQTTPDIPTLAETDKKDFLEFPRFEIKNYVFDKSKPEDSVLLFGNSALIPLQISLVSAIRKLINGASVAEYSGNALVQRKGNPLVVLFFQEDKPEEVESKDFTPVQGRISFRLMDFLEYPNSFNKEVLDWDDIEKLAKRIYDEFQKPNNKKGFLWEKGKISFNYDDPKNGYGLKIFCNQEAKGIELVKKILSLQSHSYDPKNATVSTPKTNDDYRDGTRETMVLGRRVKNSRYRPNATVRFRGAKLSLSKRPNPVKLITRGVLESFPQDD